MVGMDTAFGDCDQPHGGAPFQSWKKGFGFGHAKGPGTGNMLHPACPQQMRFTPAGDRALASSRFWRQKYEVGPATSFGIGDRPDLYPNKGITVGPDNYGDVTRCLEKSRRGVSRPGIKLKPRFPSMEEKYRDLSWPKCGPGPAKYDTSGTIGRSSLSNPVKASSYSMGTKSLVEPDFREKLGKPGPSEYEVRTKVGRNSAIAHGCLRQISMHGKVKRITAGEASPGPCKYNIRGQLDEYGLLNKINNVKGPPDQYWRDMPESAAATLRPGSSRDGEPKGLARVESSPA